MDVNQRHVKLLAENLLNHLWLASAEHAVVTKHAGQLVANSAADKSCGNRANAAGKRQNNAAVTDLLTNLLYLRSMMLSMVHVFKTTDIEQKLESI